MAKPRVPKKVSDDTSMTPAPQVATSEMAAERSNGNSGATKTVRKRTAAKPEIVKSDARATLFPINLEDEIRRLAYLLSERRGFQPGHEADDWLTAEREIRQRYHQYSA